MKNRQSFTTSHTTHHDPASHSINSGLASGRKFFVGGNWKCNGSVSQVDVSTERI